MKHRVNKERGSFSAALELLKAGQRVARAGWDGQGMWLCLVKPQPGDAEWCEVGGGYARVVLDKRRQPGDAGFDVSGFQDLIDGTTSPRLLSWIGLKTADDGFVPWLASHADLLSDDWMVVP